MEEEAGLTMSPPALLLRRPRPARLPARANPRRSGRRLCRSRWSLAPTRPRSGPSPGTPRGIWRQRPGTTTAPASGLGRGRATPGAAAGSGTCWRPASSRGRKGARWRGAPGLLAGRRRRRALRVLLCRPRSWGPVLWALLPLLAGEEGGACPVSAAAAASEASAAGLAACPCRLPGSPPPLLTLE